MGIATSQVLLILLTIVLGGIGLLSWYFFDRWRKRRVVGALHDIEGDAAGAFESGDTEASPMEARRRSLYGIPYFAWLLTGITLVCLLLTGILVQLIPPYPVPTLGERVWFTYKAPSAFEFVPAGAIDTQHLAKGEVLLPTGKRVTPADREMVRQALAHRFDVEWSRVLGTLLLMAVFFVLLLYHMSILYPSSTEKNRYLILIYLLIVLLVLASHLSSFYELLSPFLIPVPWVGMMISILVNRKIVPLTVLTTVLIVFMLSSLDAGLFLVLLAGGLVSGTSVRRARRRNEVLLAGFFVGMTMLLVYFASHLVAGESFRISEAVASLANGFLSALLVIFLLSIFELAFDLTSPFRLMEMQDLNAPLLRELFLKAPGTYHHSLAVAALAERAALRIGADELLVRVGAYYHDIGKVFNPSYFIENQEGGVNPHDDLGTVASAAVLRSHVILGLKLGLQAGLPRPITDFIAEHHGTSRIEYFYAKSRQMESGIKSEKVFQYPGPKPRSREAAIVMIADSIEAASRTLKSRDQESIGALVDKIIVRQTGQCQFDDSELTLGELELVRATLIQLLARESHQRIEYPDGQPVNPGAQSRSAVETQG